MGFGAARQGDLPSTPRLLHVAAVQDQKTPQQQAVLSPWDDPAPLASVSHTPGHEACGAVQQQPPQQLSPEGHTDGLSTRLQQQQDEEEHAICIARHQQEDENEHDHACRDSPQMIPETCFDVLHGPLLPEHPALTTPPHARAHSSTPQPPADPSLSCSAAGAAVPAPSPPHVGATPPGPAEAGAGFYSPAPQAVRAGAVCMVADTPEQGDALSPTTAELMRVRFSTTPTNGPTPVLLAEGLQQGHQQGQNQMHQLQGPTQPEPRAAAHALQPQPQFDGAGAGASAGPHPVAESYTALQPSSTATTPAPESAIATAAAINAQPTTAHAEPTTAPSTAAMGPAPAGGAHPEFVTSAVERPPLGQVQKGGAAAAAVVMGVASGQTASAAGATAGQTAGQTSVVAAGQAAGVAGAAGATAVLDDLGFAYSLGDIQEDAGEARQCILCLMY